MSTLFKINTPIPGFTGIGAGEVGFLNGEATIDADTPRGLAALHYFTGAGYRVEAIDHDRDASDVLRTSGAEPAVEARALRLEIAALKDARELEALRQERDTLRAEVEGDNADTAPPAKTATQQGEGASLTPGVADAAPDASQRELLAPPAEGAPVAEWREWVAKSERATADDVATTPRTELIKVYGAQYDADRAAQLEGSASA